MRGRLPAASFILKNMKKIYGIAFMLMLAVFAVSCKKEPKEPSRPTVFRFNTATSTLTENGFKHDFTVIVFCDIKFKLKLDDESWVKIINSEAGNNHGTTLTISLDSNNGAESRSATLLVTAGEMEKKLTITQLPMSSSLSQTNVSLRYTKAETITIYLPFEWRLELEAADWLTVEPLSGAANVSTTVSFQAKEFNFSENDRKCNGNIVIGNDKIAISVTQKTSLPEGEFAEPVFGIYNYDGAGSILTYDELSHQTNLIKSSSELLFRLISPRENKFYEIAELPHDFTVGENISFCIYQNWLSTFGYKTDFEAYVLKVDSHVVWLIDKNNVGFVIKK